MLPLHWNTWTILKMTSEVVIILNSFISSLTVITGASCKQYMTTKEVDTVAMFATLPFHTGISHHS